MSVTINGTNGVTFNDATSQSTAALWAGSTYTVYTSGGARVIGTTYTNTSNKPMWVWCGWSGNGSNAVTYMTVNGVANTSYSFMDLYARPVCGGIIPPGATYKINSTVTTSFYWAELI